MNPEIKWPSLGAGTVSQIQYGPRRVVENIVIDLAENEEFESAKTYRSAEISALDRWDFRLSIKRKPFSIFKTKTI